MTNRANLNRTPRNVKLAFDDSTISASLPVSYPTIRLLTIADALTLNASDTKRGLQLRRLNLLRPTLNHSSAIVDDILLAHGAEWSNI
jgi:hypothetical protein